MSNFFSVGDIVICIVAWWLIFFMLLPLGVQPPSNPNPAWDRGAPQNTFLKRKVYATFAITPFAWLAVRGLLVSGWFG